MKIVDMKCAVIGYSPVVRIMTDAGICGHGEAEATKSYLKPHILILMAPHGIFDLRFGMRRGWGLILMLTKRRHIFQKRIRLFLTDGDAPYF